MEKTKETIQKTLDFINFDSVRIEVEEEDKRISIFIRDKIVSPARLPELVASLTHLLRQTTREEGVRISVDINDYRKEREGLITKLARAAAKKAAVTGSAVALPAMNAYERRLVHTELAMNPNVKTESEGENRDRHVVVNPDES